MPTVDPDIARWQTDKHQIGMIEFAPTHEADDRFPYYPLPESAVFLGIVEADALCLSGDGSIGVYDNEVQDRVICQAATDQSSFVAAIKELERHFDKCIADDSYYDDMDAAALVRDTCSKLAGGEQYQPFFSSLLGV